MHEWFNSELLLPQPTYKPQYTPESTVHALNREDCIMEVLVDVALITNTVVSLNVDPLPLTVHTKLSHRGLQVD